MKNTIRYVLGSVFVSVLAACQPAPSPSVQSQSAQTQSGLVNAAPVQSAPIEAEGFSFIVMGDAPYSEADEIMLAQAIPMIKEGSYPFIIHVGDYKGGGAPCTAAHDKRQQEIIASLAPTPVFYTPGDNEWVDCDRFDNPETGQPTSDLERLSTVRSLFFSGQAPTEFGVVYQESQPENARWSYNDAEFLTLHVTGTNNARDYVTTDPLELALAAAAQRDAANLLWLGEGFEVAKETGRSVVVISMQGDMTDIEDKPLDVMCDAVSKKKTNCDGFTDLRKAIQTYAENFEGQVLLIHGDTSPFTLGQTFAGEEAPNLWRLNAAGDSGENALTKQKWGTRDVTHVTINTKSETPFSAYGLLTGKTPKAK